MSRLPSRVPERTLRDRLLFNYKQDSKPPEPLEGETWYDTETDEVKVYNGGSWQKTGVVSHTALTDVQDDQHHNPVSVSDPVVSDGSQGLSLSFGDGLRLSGGALVAALGNGLSIDPNGQVFIPADAVGATELDFEAPLGTSTGAIELALGDALAVDAEGRLHVPANVIDTSELVADSVTGTILADDAVDRQHVAADAITSTQIQTGAVGAAEIGVDAVGVSEIDFDDPLATNGRKLDLALGDALDVDANGRLHIPTNGVGTRETNLGELSGDGISYSGGSFDIGSGGVQPRHVDPNVSYDIDVDKVDGDDAGDIEATARKQALVADFVL